MWLHCYHSTQQLRHCGRNVKDTATIENSMEICQKNRKIELSSSLSKTELSKMSGNPALGNISEGNKINYFKEIACISPRSTPALFTTAKW